MACLMSHQLLNKLSIIAGEADLLRAEAATDDCQTRLRIIHTLAQEIARDCRACELHETQYPSGRCGLPPSLAAD